MWVGGWVGGRGWGRALAHAYFTTDALLPLPASANATCGTPLWTFMLMKRASPVPRPCNFVGGSGGGCNIVP